MEIGDLSWALGKLSSWEKSGFWDFPLLSPTQTTTTNILTHNSHYVYVQRRLCTCIWAKTNKYLTTVQNLSAMAQMWNIVVYVWTHFTLTKKFRCHSDRGTLESKISFSRPFLWLFTGNKFRRRSNWELYSVKYLIKNYPMRKIMITLPRSWKNSRT